MENQRRRMAPTALLFLALALPSQHSTLAFSVERLSMRTAARRSRLRLSRDEYLQPHSETSSITTERNYDFDFERIVECAQVGECPVDEMTQMLEELTLLDEKEGVPSGIYLEAESEEARNAVLHALNSQVELAKARSGLKEAGLERMTKSLIFSRLVECAQVDECPVEEMTQMLEDLKHFDETERASDGIALEAESEDVRNAVFHALISRVELARARSELSEAGLARQKHSELQPPPPSERDIQDLTRQRRDIADHEEV